MGLCHIRLYLESLMWRQFYTGLLGALWVSTAMFPSEIFAQSALSVDSSNVSTYDVSRYRVEDGLSQNTIKDMVFDREGFLWLSTEKGYSRFDGESFRNYTGPPFRTDGHRPKDFYKIGDTIISASRPSFIFVDGKVVFDSIYWQSLDICMGPHSQVFEMNFDVPILENRYLMFGNAREMGSPFYHMDDGTFYFQREAENDGVIGGLEYYGSDSILGRLPFTPLHSEEPGFVKDQYLGVINYPLLKIYEGISCVDSMDISALGPNSHISWRYKGEPYLNAPDHGRLYQILIKNGKLSLKLILKSTAGIGTISRIIRDPQGQSYWVGTRLQGLYRFKPHEITNWAAVDQPWIHKELSCVQVGKDSLLSRNGVVITPSHSYLIEPDDTALTRYLFSKASHPFELQMGDRYYVRNKTGHRHKLLETVPQMGHYIEDKKGRLFCDIAYVIHTEDDCKWVPVNATGHGNTLWKSIHYNQYEDEIWVTASFLDDKVYIFKPDEKVFEPQDLLPTGSVYHMYFDRDGMEFLRYTDRGYVMHRNDTVVPMPMDPLGYLQYAHCIVEDELGYFWISSDQGLFRVLRQDLKAHFKDPDLPVFYHYYDESSGIPNIEFNSRNIPCGIRMDDGKIAFPSFEGFAIIDAEKVTQPFHGNGLIIDRIGIDQKDTILDAPAVLKQNFKELEFHIRHVLHDHPNNLYIHYKLEGFHDEWRTLPDDGIISFSKLGHGQYDLLVRKLIGSGEEGVRILSFPFIVQKKLTETAGFRIAIVLLLLLVIYILIALRTRFYRRQQKQLEETIDIKTREYRQLNDELKLNLLKLRNSEEELRQNSKMKDQMMAIYTHDIRGPLRFIMTVAEKCSSLAGKKKLDLNYYFGAIHSTTEKLYRQTERVFNWSKFQEDDTELKRISVNLYEAVQNSFDDFSEQAREKGISFHNKVDKSLNLSTEGNMLEIILNNLIQNAIKFTTGGSISLQSGKVKGYIIVRVTDTGVGIKDELLEKLRAGKPISTEGTNKEKGSGFGLKVIRDFMSRLNGQVEIESQYGKGTSVILFFKNN